jgi:uncharacterized membrane protein SirB2
MSLLPLFEWMETIALSVAFRDSVWLYPLDQAIHLVALTVFAGAVLIVDLRLMGGLLKKQPVSQVAADAQPWMMGAFTVLVITGIPQMTQTAMKQYYSPYFWWKMELLAIALVFTFTVRRRVTRADEGRISQIWPKLVGLVSIALWLGVTVSARLIGLLA